MRWVNLILGLLAIAVGVLILTGILFDYSDCPYGIRSEQGAVPHCGPPPTPVI